MAENTPASAAGQFRVGGDIPVNRLAFGAMRVTGPGVWGPPQDPAAARETLRRLPALGIHLIDTADSYGPCVSENLIREVLHPYDGLLIATKGGLVRGGPNDWHPVGRPEYLRQCVQMSLRRLGLERLDLWQLHAIDPAVPREEQFQAIAALRDEGLIRHVGLSGVNIDDIEAAERHFPVTTVQNRYNLLHRRSEAVLDYCERRDIGFIPWYPLEAGKLSGPESPCADIARRLGSHPAQVALAWLLQRSPVILPIAGTANPQHLALNAAAAELILSKQDFAALDRLAAAG